jgi:hypothetical protein
LHVRAFFGAEGAVEGESSSPSPAAADDNTEQKRDQQRTKRRFARNIAKDTQGHSRFPASVDRAADTLRCVFDCFRYLLDGGFGLRSRIKAIVNEWRDLIAHG